MQAYAAGAKLRGQLLRNNTKVARTRLNDLVERFNIGAITKGSSTFLEYIKVLLNVVRYLRLLALSFAVDPLHAILI